MKRGNRELPFGRVILHRKLDRKTMVELEMEVDEVHGQTRDDKDDAEMYSVSCGRAVLLPIQVTLL